MAWQDFFRRTDSIRDELALELATQELRSGIQMGLIEFVERKNELAQELEVEGIDRPLMVGYLDNFCDRLR